MRGHPVFLVTTRSGQTYQSVALSYAEYRSKSGGVYTMLQLCVSGLDVVIDASEVTEIKLCPEGSPYCSHCGQALPPSTRFEYEIQVAVQKPASPPAPPAPSTLNTSEACVDDVARKAYQAAHACP